MRQRFYESPPPPPLLLQGNATAAAAVFAHIHKIHFNIYLHEYFSAPLPPLSLRSQSGVFLLRGGGGGGGARRRRAWITGKKGKLCTAGRKKIIVLPQVKNIVAWLKRAAEAGLGLLECLNINSSAGVVKMMEPRRPPLCFLPPTSHPSSSPLPPFVLFLAAKKEKEKKNVHKKTKSLSGRGDFSCASFCFKKGAKVRH